MDSRRKKSLIVLCLASLVFAWRGYALLDRIKPTAAQASEAPAEPETGTVTAIPEKPAAAADSPALWEVQQIVAAQPWGRDPFAEVPGAAQTAEPTEEPTAQGEQNVPPPPSLQFTGVSLSDDNWLAVVRGNIVRMGDLVDGRYKVVAMTKGSITVAADGWTFRYELGSETPSIWPPSENP